jgi:hypothetical protein
LFDGKFLTVGKEINPGTIGSIKKNEVSLVVEFAIRIPSQIYHNKSKTYHNESEIIPQNSRLQNCRLTISQSLIFFDIFSCSIDNGVEFTDNQTKG